jgi:putative ABC transport system permease protein
MRMRSDLTNAFRALRSAPSFTAVALIVLTLGIGATTAIFSVVDGVVLRNVPFSEPDQLISVSDIDTQPDGFSSGHTTVPDYLDWASGQQTFEGLAATTGGGGFTVRDGGHPETLVTTRATSNLFPLLRVQPQLGRLYTTDHEVEGNHQVAVISHSLWQRRFAGAPDVVGKTMTFDTGRWEILGVMPEGFEYPVGAVRPAEMWVPYVAPESQKLRGNSRNYSLLVVGRLKAGATIEQAQQELGAIAAGIKAAHPKWNPTREVRVRSLHESLVGRVRGWMLMLLGAVAFVMLIACVNVANLYLARATARSRDVGIRSALGASRWQLIRGFLIESLVLSAIGTFLAVVLAYWGVALLKAALPTSLPRARDIGLDFRVLAVAATAAVATGLLCGLAPAFQLTRPNLTGALRDGGRSQTAGVGRQWLRSALVTSEVALAVILLVGAGLFVSSFVRLSNVNIGLDHRNVLTVPVYPPFVFGEQAQRDAARARAELLVPQVIERVRQLPGVVSVGGIANGLPLSGSWSRTNVTVPGNDKKFEGAESVDTRSVTTDYFTTVGIPLLRGRFLEDADRTGPPVIVLNDTAARMYLGDADPIGGRVNINGERTVVGVVASVRLGGPESEVRPESYQPMTPKAVFGADLVIKTAGRAEDLAPAVRAAILDLAPDLVLGETQTMELLFSRLVAQRRFNMMLLTIFGALGIVITAVGIYGVMAYVVEQRTTEIGVRMALGAQPRRVLGMMLTRAMAYVTVGLAVGLAGAFALSRFVETFLFRVEPGEPVVYVGTAAVLVVTGLVAAWIPSRRAARVDPIIALRG